MKEDVALGHGVKQAFDGGGTESGLAQEGGEELSLHGAVDVRLELHLNVLLAASR